MLPIIYVHWGNSDYLKYSIHQSKYFNPDSRIILLGDKKNNKYKQSEHFYISDYSKSADEFEKIYKHLCFLSYYYVLFWFKRWFVIKDFLEKQDDINNFLYIDSDVLLFSNITLSFKPFEKNKLTIHGERGPQYTYFNSKKTLFDFCNFITRLYTEEKLFHRLLNKFELHKKNNLPGGVDDMHALYEYVLDFPDNIGNTAHEINQTIFDGNLNYSEGFEYDEKKKIKKIYWKENLPHACLLEQKKYIQLNAIHFQGDAKKFMHKFYIGENLFFSKMYSNYYYGVFFPAAKLYQYFIKSINHYD